MAADDIRDSMKGAKEVKPRGPAKPAPSASGDNVVALKPKKRSKPETNAQGKRLTDYDLWWRDVQPTLEFDDGDWPLRPECPVVALGKGDGEYHYYASASRRLIAWLPKDHSRNNLVSAFGGNAFLRHCYPRFDRNSGALTGFRPEAVADAMMFRAEEAGHWSPAEKVRGPGAWIDAAGQLIYHCGNLVLHDGKWKKPDVFDGVFYARGNNAPLPAAEMPAGGEGGAGAAVLDLLQSWNWARPIDALLLLGWIYNAMQGGATDWRPFVWITGDTSTGKSTLHRLIKCLLGDATVAVSDTTAAGIFQRVKHSSLPVQVDELEAKADNRKVKAVVELARLASSGGIILRGGADHQGHEFSARNCFMFSSILIPPLPSQDLTRIAILELKPLDPKAKIKVDEKQWRTWGDDLRARVIGGWPRWGETLGAFRTAMIEHGGHNARGADQFGSLLAGAHLGLYDDAPDAGDLVGPAKELSVKRLNDANAVMSNSSAAKTRLTSWYDREALRLTIGEMLEQATRAERQGSFDAARAEAMPDAEKKKATDRLAQLGLLIEWRFDEARRANEPAAVLIANQNDNLAQVFAGTIWAGEADGAGVWRQAFKRLDGADTAENRTKYFAGAESKCIRVPMHHFQPRDEQQQEAAE